jgi:hypothetical protein
VSGDPDFESDLPRDDVDEWLERVLDAFRGKDRRPLAVAESAVRACPRNPNVLLLAAAALSEARRDREHAAYVVGRRARSSRPL